MSEFLLAHEAWVRMAVFFGLLVALAGWEAACPKRRREIPRLLRWSNNLGIVMLDSLLVRLLFPVVAVGLALTANEAGWGLLPALGLPVWLAVILTIIVLDLVIYLQHALFHAVPGLWRLHRMHHADLEIDVSTALRFHPIEILLSMLIKLAVVAALGPPAVAVLLFEILLNATAMFNHSNLRLPTGVDRVLRWVVVTPDMHRVHHSVDPAETNTNFGFNLPWWDRMFGTYCAQPKLGHDGMSIGIEQFRTRRDLYIDRMLTQPFRGPASGSSLDADSGP